MFKKSGRILRFFLVIFVLSSQLAFPMPAQAALQDWMPVNGPQIPGGVITDLTQSQSDPNILFALLDDPGGDRLYRSLDRSDHWTMVHQFAASDSLSDLAVDPGNSDVVYIGSSTGLLRSTDGGSHWDLFNTLGKHFAAPAAGTIDAVGKADPKPASCNFYEYTFTWTTDGGDHWNTSDLGCFYAYQVNVLGSQLDTIYVLASKYIAGFPRPIYEGILLKSQDGGMTWQSYSCSSCSDLAIDPLNPQRLFASEENHVSISQDGGQTWDTNLNYDLGINCLVGCGLRLAVSGSSLYAIPVSDLSQTIFRSQDGGNNWWQSVGVLPAGGNALIADVGQTDRIYAGLLGFGVYRTENGGASWTEANHGIQTAARLTAVAVAPSNPQVIYAASDYPRRALFSTQDGGQTWSPPLLDGEYDGPFHQPGKEGVRFWKLAVQPNDPATALAGGDSLYGTQNGSNWYQLYNFRVTDLKVSPSYPNYPFAATESGIAYKAPVIYGPPGYLQWYFSYTNKYFPSALAIDPSQPDRILVASNSTTENMGIAIDIYASTDNGLTFQKLSEIPPDISVENLEISPSDAQMVLLTTKDTWKYSNWAMISRDGGKTWTPWSEGLTGGGSDSFLAVDSNSVAYYGGTDGVYARLPNGPAWLPMGLQGQTILAMALYGNHPKFLLAATGQGLFHLNLDAYSLWMPLVTR